jgi:hypothetical protein
MREPCFDVGKDTPLLADLGKMAPEPYRTVLAIAASFLEY